MENRIDYDYVIDYIDSYQGNFDQEMLSIFRDLAKKAKDSQDMISKFSYLNDQKSAKDIISKILKGIETGKFVKGTISKIPDGRFKMPFYQAMLENYDKVLFIFVNSDTTRGKVGDEVEFYATRKNDDGYTIFGRIPKKTL